MKRFAIVCLLGLSVGCDRIESGGSRKAVADSVMVESVVDSMESEPRRDSAAVHESPGDGRAFLKSLEEAMVPVRDTLVLEFARIRRLPNVAQRDSAILELKDRWGRIQQSQLQNLLDQSAFTSRMWIDSLKSSDTAFKRKVRQILCSGGKYLEYNEGFTTEADLGARPDLVDSVASPSLSERLRREHEESKTGVYNDAGIIVPLDTLVGRIQGWEAFARKFPGTPSAAWAESVRKGYLYSLLCGATNTSAFDNGVPGEEFVRAWNRLAAGPDGASRSLVREWLKILEAENGRLTPKARKWLGERGFDPVDMISEGA
ncbi:MAG: hypothetical protein IPK50_18775 [Fibrobacterota bacterium]|nr:MAG: hypothetical protein IPK50_18775 [Fibrobacterota bacterium]